MKHTNILLFSIIQTFLLVFASNAVSHVGGRDQYGCHNNNALNQYECHGTIFPGRSWPNPGGKESMLAELTPVPPVIIFSGAVLTWNPNKETNLAGYKLYWGVLPGRYQKPIDLGKVTRVELTNLLKGATYYFALTAYNTAGKESTFSNEVFKSVS